MATYPGQPASVVYPGIPVREKKVTMYPGTQQEELVQEPLGGVKAPEPTVKLPTKAPVSQTMAQDIALKSASIPKPQLQVKTAAVPRSSSQQQTQANGQNKKPSAAGVAGAAAGMGANYAINEGLSTAAGEGAVAAGETAASAAPIVGPTSTVFASEAAVPAGYTAVASAEGGGVVAAPTTAVTSPASGISAMGAAGAAASVAGGIVAIHQFPQMQHEMQMGDMKGSITHGAAAGAGAGAAVGGTVGSIVPGVGTLVGAGIGAAIGTVVGAIAGAVGASRTGKDKDQLMRDMVRDVMQDNKMLDDNYQVELADGSKFDMGVDGHGKNFDGSGYAYQVARDNPFSVQAVGWAGAFATILTGGQKKLATDFTGYFANAAMSNAKDMEAVRANILHFMDQAGVTRQMMEESLGELKKSGSLSEQEYAAHMASLNTLFSGEGYVTMSWAEAEKQMGGATTDQNPANVQTPSADAPDHQTGPAIYDVDPGRIPPDQYQKMVKLYGYYDANKQKRQAAKTQPDQTVASDVAAAAAQMGGGSGLTNGEPPNPPVPQGAPPVPTVQEGYGPARPGQGYIPASIAAQIQQAAGGAQTAPQPPQPPPQQPLEISGPQVPPAENLRVMQQRIARGI